MRGRLVGLWLGMALLMGWGWSQPIVVAEGTAEIRASADEPWRPAQSGDVLVIGGELRTFQGAVTLELEGGVLRLAPETHIERQTRQYRLIAGRSYTQATDVTFMLGGPVRVVGEARFDVIEELGQRAAILSGTGRLTFVGRVIDVVAGEQLVIPLGGQPSLSLYYERDPWYRDLLTIGEGRASVLGFAGEAQLRRLGEDWQAVQAGMPFEVGDEARTGAASWLELRFDDGNLVRLQADTEIALTQLDDFADGTRRTLLELRRGRLWAVVEDEDSPFEIETPGLVAGVRGTTFRVDAADNGEPPVIKTFEGVVAGITGFEVVEVAAGEQFDPQVGVMPLIPDAIDQFNLGRDRLIQPPPLLINPLPSQVADDLLQLTGVSEAEVRLTARSLRGSVTQVTTQPDFILDIPLGPGFNIIELTAQRAEGAAQATFSQPIIRSGAVVQLAVAEPQQLQGTYRLRGFTAAGATVVVSAGEAVRQVTADSRGRFYITIGTAASEAQVTVFLSEGDTRPAASTTIQLP